MKLSDSQKNYAIEKKEFRKISNSSHSLQTLKKELKKLMTEATGKKQRIAKENSEISACINGVAKEIVNFQHEKAIRSFKDRELGAHESLSALKKAKEELQSKLIRVDDHIEKAETEIRQAESVRNSEKREMEEMPSKKTVSIEMNLLTDGRSSRNSEMPLKMLQD